MKCGQWGEDVAGFVARHSQGVDYFEVLGELFLWDNCEMESKLIVDLSHASNVPSKDEALANLSKALEVGFFKAIADPVRQKIILILLQNGKSSIQDVTKHMVQDRSVVSRHLMLLKQAGVVKRQKTDHSIAYELDGNSIIVKLEMLLNSLRLAAQQCCPLPNISTPIKSAAESFPR